MAVRLHWAMWGNDLKERLHNVENSEDLEYLPRADVQDLHLEALGCQANTIIVREEYPFTLKKLDNHRPNIEGMVVTGHPGIDMTSLQKVM